ncbi:MAG: hypothetical protein ACLUXK_13470 [[Ruminococcus] torques]|jgi:hypothetical protein|nr:MAG TPA: hypothetical protein [Caudoviricetes sp.]
MENIYELYKQIIKHDMKAVDEIESLEQAKDIIKMILQTDTNNARITIKKRQIIALQECSFCMIEESNGKVECVKNRFGNRTMEACEGYNFEAVKLSDISTSESIFDIQKKYYGKNIWLLLDK